MDEERVKKIEAGREKLAAYKKRKEKRGKSTADDVTPSQDSDSSLSLSLSDLPDNAPNKEVAEQDLASDSSTISEHLQSSAGSVEHDRSYQEIEILPSNFSLILQNLPPDNEIQHISQENDPASINSSPKSDTLNINDKLSDATNNVQSILNDILKSEHFKSQSDHLVDKSDSLDTNGLSLNIFEGVSLDDSSINNYVSKLRQYNDSRGFNNDDSLNEKNLYAGNFAVSHKSNDSSVGGDDEKLCSDDSAERIKILEEQLINKDNEIAALTAELDSHKEMTSNHSTLSLNTTTTEYKHYQEEHHNKIVEYQNAIAHRDTLILQLTESLQQSLLNREELQQQSENFAKEISLLQKQLIETSNIIKQHDCSAFVPTIDAEASGEGGLNKTKPADTVDNNNMGSLDISADVKTSSELGTEEKVDAKNSPEKFVRDKTDLEIAQREKPVLDLERECSILEDILSVNQLNILNNLKVNINMYIQQEISESRRSKQNEIKVLKDRLESEKSEHETEVIRLRELLASVKCGSTEIMELRQELDAKHAREMEELRTYFEKKCADLEKHYSEEIFSQQSRKMSGSSSCSEAEMSSDIIYSGRHPQPGPGGDTAPPSIDQNKINLTKRDLGTFSKKDILKLKKELTNVINELNKFDLNNLSKDDLNKLQSELTKYDLRSLAKYDLSAMKHDMQNRYHAELEILREDCENRIDLLNVDHESKLRSLKESYQEQVDALKYELNEAMRTVQMNVSTAVQEVASSGEYELAEVVQSYERRLQEQITVAKFDIISALEHQIQMLAASADDMEWPAELLQIRDRFAVKYEAEIRDLKEQHQREIILLKEEHAKVLNGALERARRRSLRDNESYNKSDLDIIKDRDNLKKSNSALRHLLGELLKYFTQCEDELNNTLVEEIIKHGFEKSLTQIEGELNLDDSIRSSPDSAVNTAKRVHLAPNFSDFMNIVDNSLSNFESKDLSIDLKNELGTCLERLRADANAILALSANIQTNPNRNSEIVLKNSTEVRNLSLEEKITSLTRQLITDSQIKNDLTVQLSEARDYVQSLESERVSLENQVEQLIAKQKILESDFMKATKKISDLVECGHKEIISEGYGQNLGANSLGFRIASLAELQERARTLVADWKNGADHPLIQLVEELCREGERITDEAKKDHDDLHQQIDAADKKLRATCHFLEEQAAEREQERDEAQKEISLLREQLKEKEKDRMTCEMVTKEVEQLEQQMREMTKLIEEGDLKQQETENERKEAVDKIWVLRDIIRDLESQVETRTETESQLKNIVAELEELVKQQNKTNEDLNQQLESYKSLPDVQHLKERVVFLENETQKLRLSSELVGSEGAVREIQIQLNEFEATIEKQTRDLEGLHSAISTTSCSSPSEDMSIRDQIRPHSPTQPSPPEECDVPLQQLARLKEKLLKHTRAEDAAVKRIRDLEMQLVSSKHDLEEAQNEKEILQDQVSEQLILISSLQMRLDEQRLRAEHVQKQANTSLEVRIYDLENELQTLKDTIHSRDKTVKQLNKVIEQTKQRLEDRESELSSKAEDNVIINLQQEIEHLRQENGLLKTKIDSDAQNAQILPGLVDNIIADKNSDIEKLRQALVETQSQLDVYLSLNLDREQLRQLSQLKSSDRAFTDILSLVEFDVSDPVRKADSQTDSINNSVNLLYKRNTNETAIVGGGKFKFEPEISTIEKVGPPNINFTLDAPLVKPNSTELQHKSLEKHVRFEDSVVNLKIEKFEREVAELKSQVTEKDGTISEFTERLKALAHLETNIEKLQKNLEHTEYALSKATETFEKEQNSAAETEKTLRIELAEKKMHLTEKEKQLEYLEQDAGRKDQMYMNLAKEKRELELRLNELEENQEHYENFDKILSEKNKEIHHLEEQLVKLIETGVHIEELETQLSTKEAELKNLLEKFASLEIKFKEKTKDLENAHRKSAEQSEELKDMQDINSKLEKEIHNKSEQIDSLSQQINNLKVSIDEKSKQIEGVNGALRQEQTELVTGLNAHISKLQNLLVDRECEIEILNEDITRYQNELVRLEGKLKDSKSLDDSETQLQLMKNRKEIAEKDLEIVKMKAIQDDLNKEIVHLQDYLNEKDRIIEQMKIDTKSLHINLEKIQNKIQETGNIVDLRKRLQEQQHINAVLEEENNNLKSALDPHDHKERSISIEEIAGQVQKELDYSARLDSSILQALSSGDELNAPETANLKDELTKERQQKAKLAKAKAELQQELQNLELQLDAEKENANQLRIHLDREKHTCNTIQIEDANLIEQMRIQLESALENENEFQNILDEEKKLRQELELQVAALKQRASNVSGSSNSKTELTEYKHLPNMDSQEIIQLRQQLAGLKGENEKLKTDLKSLRRAKNEHDANLKYTKDMLQLKNSELEKSENRNEELRRSELAVKEKLVQYKMELEQRRREVENSRILMGELEQERFDMKKEIESLGEKLRDLIEERKLVDIALEERGANLSSSIPDKFLNKMKELSQLVKEHMNENTIMTETLAKLTSERAVLQERIRHLEEQNNYKMPFDDPSARANHLFGKYLRSDSYRKALIWQKRYLIALLATYQNFRPLSERLPLINFESKNSTAFRSKGKSRFRSAVIAVIVIIRMRYLVQRWHSGKRMGAHMHLSQYKNAAQYLPQHNNNNNINVHSTQFQLGQPVSSQNFSSNTRRPSVDQRFGTPLLRSNSRDLHNFAQFGTHEVPGTSAGSAFEDRPGTPRKSEKLPPWSGSTPPQKEKHHVSSIPDNTATNGNLAALQAPHLLTQYVKRFNEIQQRLGMAIENLNT